MAERKSKRRFEVSVPEFDPELDVLYINVGEGAFEFVADLNVMFEIEKLKGDDEGEDVGFTPELVITVLTAGLKRRHPDITRETVEEWFSSPIRGTAIAQSFMEYIQYITERAEEAGQGEDLKTRGSTSGPTVSTTSASRRKKSGGSSRAPSKR